MPSRIVKGHSRIVVVPQASYNLGLFPTENGYINITKRSCNGYLQLVATLSPESALALQAALNDMLLELEVIEQQKAAEQPND